MRTLSIAILAVSCGLAAAPAGAQGCAFSAERTATLSVAGMRRALVAARAGSLRIEGRAGLQEIRARGTACASTAQLLQGVRLVASRESGEARLVVEMPEMEGMGNRYASLDLVIEVPETLDLHVTDSSGDLEIRRVGGLTLEDSSGEIELADIRGSLDVEDSSGNVRIDGVRGDVRLRDSSGDLHVRDVAGTVLVENDSSGNIDLDQVGGDAIVRNDSSGDIAVTRVRGDFTVEHDSNGGIRYDDVAGRVQVPQRRARR